MGGVRLAERSRSRQAGLPKSGRRFSAKNPATSKEGKQDYVGSPTKFCLGWRRSPIEGVVWGSDMRCSLVSWLTAAAIALLTVGGPTAANAESVMRLCATQWKEAKAAGTTGGQTWPQFLAQCRASESGAAAAPASAPAPASQSGSLFPWWRPSAPASNVAAPSGGESVMRECASQWKEAKAAGTTGGQTWPQFLAQCRANRTAAASPSGGFAPAPAPASAPAPAPASQSGSPFPWWRQSSAPASAPASNGGSPSTLRANQYTTELAARARCPSDTVVWVNTPTGVYHYSGTRYYGRTRRGAYMCEADARASGYRAARGREREAESHPG